MVEILQTREMVSMNKQSDGLESETHGVEVKDCDPCPRTGLAAAARLLQTPYPYG